MRMPVPVFIVIVFLILAVISELRAQVTKPATDTIILMQTTDSTQVVIAPSGLLRGTAKPASPVVDAFTDVAKTALGVILGGMVTLLTSRVILRQQKQAELQHELRLMFHADFCDELFKKLNDAIQNGTAENRGNLATFIDVNLPLYESFFDNVMIDKLYRIREFAIMDLKELRTDLVKSLRGDV